MAPEIIKGVKYGAECDMWSIGVIAFMLLGNQTPFTGKDDMETARKIQSCNYDFDKKDWLGVSKDA